MTKSVVPLLMLLASMFIYAEEKSLTHIVLCWMDSTVSDEEIEELIVETRELEKIPGVNSLSVGAPVVSERSIVDDSFSFGITMSFSGVKEMNRYLADERHTTFVNTKIKPSLKKIKVYDIESGGR